MFYILRPLSKKMDNMPSSLANQIVHIFTSSGPNLEYWGSVRY